MDTPFTWLQWNNPTANDYNEKPRADSANFTSNGTLWGYFDSKSGGPETLFDSDQPATTATIRLYQWVEIGVKDRLLDLQFNETYKIESVTKDFDKYETVLSVKRTRVQA